MATNPKLPDQARSGPQPVPGAVTRREQQALKRYVMIALIIIGVLIAALVVWFVRSAGKGPAPSPAPPPRTTQLLRTVHRA
ncbi:MAG: hypothetical protein JO187_00710 [Acidobacteria bacterium]|nr:hypothetical protein [Acidobacteriota bacterium]